MSEDYGISTLSSVYRQQHCIETANGVCALCGDSIDFDNEEYTVDHIIPKFCLKWSVSIREEDKGTLKGLLSSKHNQVVVHKRCNYRKGCASIDVSELHITEEMKNNIKSLLEKLEPCVKESNNIMEKVSLRQKKRCALCNKLIEIKGEFSEGVALRRIDEDKPRTLDNAVCICKKCNIIYSRVRKNRMEREKGVI